MRQGTNIRRVFANRSRQLFSPRHRRVLSTEKATKEGSESSAQGPTPPTPVPGPAAGFESQKEPEEKKSEEKAPAAPAVPQVATTDSTGAWWAERETLRDFDAEAKLEKEFKNRWRQSDNARLIMHWRAHGRNVETTLLKFPKFLNRFIAEPMAPMWVPPPEPEPEPELEERKEKAKEPETPEKKWKRRRGYAYFYLFCGVVYYLYKWNSVRGIAQEEAAKQIGSATNKELKILSDLALLVKENIPEIHDWLLENEGEAMTAETFGERFAEACALLRPTNQAMPQLEGIAEAHKPPMQDNKQPYPYDYSQKIEPYDAHSLFRDMELEADDLIPLPLLVTAISHLAKTTFFDMPSKVEGAFFAFYLAAKRRAEAAGEPFPDDPDPADKLQVSLAFPDFLQLVEAMFLTGHMFTESMVNHTGWMPPKYDVATPEDCAREYFAFNSLDPDSPDARITLHQLREAMVAFPLRRSWHLFSAGYSTWYCTRHQMRKADDLKKEWEAKQKKEAEEAKKAAESAS